MAPTVDQKCTSHCNYLPAYTHLNAPHSLTLALCYVVGGNIKTAGAILKPQGQY